MSPLKVEDGRKWKSIVQQMEASAKWWRVVLKRQSSSVRAYLAQHIYNGYFEGIQTKIKTDSNDNLLNTPCP